MASTRLESTSRTLRLLLAALTCVVLPSLAQAAAPQPLFESDAMLPLTLAAPLRDLAADKNDEELAYLPGTVSYVAGDGSGVDLAVEVRVRGNYRRRECRFPPLRLRFDKSQAAGTLFEGQRRLKLVAPCKRGARYEQYVVEEYLLYRLYELLGEHAFRVRPLTVTFADGERRKRSSFAFVIEDEKRMARRYGLKTFRAESVSYDALEPAALATFGLFQFLISSHDWSVVAGPPGSRCCHNARLLAGRDGSEPLIPVPYDFDFAGIIDTSYATPPESLPIKRVRQRYYRGRCAAPSLWSDTVARFRSNRAAIGRLYEAFEPLSEKRRRRALKYIDQFYAILDDPDRLQRELLDRCTS